MEVYINDMLVKSAKEQDHIKDLEECFQILTTFGLKLNLAKCTFGVRGRRFLGYMISERGIEANPEKINTIMDMSPPKSIREVQKLAGRLATLNRFISRSADKGLPLFKMLRGGAKFEWSKNGQEAFDELKKYLVSPHLLTKPETGETLYLYLEVSENVVSSVLVRQENREHQLVYYVIKVLQGAEPRYSQIEKLALSLVIAARKLRPYFQSHQVTVLTNHHLKQLLATPKLSGRMVKWAVELSEYDIEFHRDQLLRHKCWPTSWSSWHTTKQASLHRHGVICRWIVYIDEKWSWGFPREPSRRQVRVRYKARISLIEQ
ncbi:UNVERIFIED_CONTAM: Gag-Pol polyprotein [Sesamum calycinum]|uniref:Gag-Pol polyprotein n=1 Tax=Sesamum calycinum TaxID=2727403 RepID=A0AAW2SFZ6_9LAMI